MSTVKRNLVLIGLSVVYLTFELAFNARLLDVVGGGATADQVHAIEVYGRSLSGIALGLVVLGTLWKLRSTSTRWAFSWGAILLLSAAAAGGVYVVLERVVDYLARDSSPEFRRTSLNIVLLQNALVEGRAELEGLTDTPDLFATPEGKAFLALFPAMAVSVDRLDEKIRQAKLSLIEHKLRQELGGVRGFHDRYQDGVDEIRRKFADYQRLPTEAINVDAEVAKQQDKAWEDFLRDLGKNGFTPSTVPPQYRARVVKKVRAQIPVPSDWTPNDEPGFRAAVASQTRKRLGRVPGADGVSIGGRKVAPGLSWPDFFAHEGVQSELRKKLEIPAGQRLLPVYGNAAGFDQAVLRPMVSQRAARELKRYEAPAASFAYGGAYEKDGLDAARATLVPPIALFCSLIGATLHLGKIFFLVFQTARARAAEARPRALQFQSWVLFATVLAVALASLRVMENEVTRSRLYQYMVVQLLETPTWQRQAVSHAMHIIAVGQAYTYPYNEAIRNHVLAGITYGYRPSRP